MSGDPAPQGCAPPSGGTPAYWAPARKDAVGTALGPSRLWFTLAQGILTEVYYPRPDIPQLRDLGFIVADGDGFWSEVRRLDDYAVTCQDGVVPAISIVHRHERYTLRLQICSDPERDVLLVAFDLTGDAALELHVLAAPRIGGDATQNLAWADAWMGRPVLWAEQGPFGLALAAVDEYGAPGLRERSVGCVGESDGWQDFKSHGRRQWHYAAAGPGEVALTARIGRAGALAVGFSSSREAAATLALESLAVGFPAAWEAYCLGWRNWLDEIDWPKSLGQRLSPEAATLVMRSASVIRCHADKSFPGATVASLSVPWGETSASRGGYHLVWSRDLVEAAGALLGLGCVEDARRALVYLMSTQQADGHWLQNQWLGGKAFWQGIQLDETAFPVLLASALAERDALGQIDVRDMVRRALGFIAREGPMTGQDRWEEDSGVNTFTVAAAIAALVEGGRFLAGREMDCALMLADGWNSRLEGWAWVADTALARKLGVSGYYMRTVPDDALTHDGAKHEGVLIKNRAQCMAPAADEQLAIDCLALVRFGLRSADDPEMAASMRAIDALLRTDTPSGPVWHRYTGDGYGEHPDGAAFDGWGIGRGWPLLTGERGHAALLAGDDAVPYLEAMVKMAGAGGLLPEQVWDSAPIPERGLWPGRPSGSAMPLVWAHAEFVKLALSIVGGAPVDRPARTWARYGGVRPQPGFALWQLRQPVREIDAGQELRLLFAEPAQVHWGRNGWLERRDAMSEDWGLGHVLCLPTQELSAGEIINFTCYWPRRSEWQGEDFQVRVVV